jgi:HrpA-like RNA helicase
MRLQMMLYGAIFGCLSPILSVAAFLSYKSPFLSPKDEVSYDFNDEQFTQPRCALTFHELFIYNTEAKCGESKSHIIE